MAQKYFHQCCAKSDVGNVYSSFSLAEKAAKERMRESGCLILPYKCSFCSKYHIGGRKATDHKSSPVFLKEERRFKIIELISKRVIKHYSSWDDAVHDLKNFNSVGASYLLEFKGTIWFDGRAFVFE